MVLTIEQANELWYFVFEYEAGWYSYEDDDWIEYLIIDWVEVASGYLVFQFAHDVWEVMSEPEWDYTLFYKWEKVCDGYKFSAIKRVSGTEYIVSTNDLTERTIDVTNRTTWL